MTVKPTANTLAGNGLQKTLESQTYTFTLQPYQVLNVKSDYVGTDLTGSIVTSDKPVAVFSGHEAATSGSVCCADHLEQQLFPVSTWGKTYVAAKSFPRAAENDYWRIVAATNGTTVTFDPPTVSPPVSLNRGKHVEVATKEDFVIQASAPVLVAQVLASSHEVLGVADANAPCATNDDCPTGYSCEQIDEVGNKRCLGSQCAPSEAGCPPGHGCSCRTDDVPVACPTGGFECLFGSAYPSCIEGLCQSCGCEPIGDPALILTPPVEQFRKDYVFLVPGAYAEDFVTVVAPIGATVKLDGSTFTAAAFTPIGGSGFAAAKLKIADGVHALVADQPVGVVVYGYDDDVSYGYTAGLDLQDL